MFNIFKHKHNWYYNFTTLPNKRICSKCKKRERLNLRSMEWINTFLDKRSDDELIDQWFGYIK